MNRKWQVLFLVLSLLCALFIFSNSMVAEQKMSTRESGILKAVENVINHYTTHSVHLDTKTAHTRLAKLAHLGEFAVFSALFTTAVFAFRKETRPHFLKILFVGVFCAVTDEHLQLVTDGRSSRVSDVMIDLCGVLIGYAIASGLLWLIRKRKEKKNA